MDVNLVFSLGDGHKFRVFEYKLLARILVFEPKKEVTGNFCEN
jgi:hypothetical protein